MFKAAHTIGDIAKEAVDFLAPHIKVERLIVYGSYAYGSPREDSDFDIAVISPDFQDMPALKKIELFSRAALAVDSRLELKGYTSDEFLNPEQGSLLELIKSKGETIFP